MLISILLPSLGGGGTERVRLLLAEHFLRKSPVEFVLLQARGELQKEVPKGATVVDLDAPRLRSAFIPLVRYLRRRRPTALLAAPWPLTTAAIWARNLAQVPTRVVVSDHTNYLALPRWNTGLGRFMMRSTMRWSYSRADGVLAVSHGVADAVADLAKLPRERIAVVHNPARPLVTTNLAAPAGLAPVWAAHAGPRIIAVGALKPAKNYPMLLTAFAKLSRHQSGARLLILGEGGLRPELEEFRARLGLEGAVDIPGFAPDPYPYLVHADLFVLSSDWEGLPGVVIEALVCGTPVVATDCPSGPAEILEDGKYGRLVPVGDAEALAAAMVQALAEPPDRDFLRARGAEFSVERAADQYLDLLDPGGRLLARV